MLGLTDSEVSMLMLAVGSVAALVCLFFSLRAVKRRRLIENIPTSKTTGVFMGLVELKGTAEAETPLCSYLDESACVQYAWEVEEHWSRTVTETYTDSDGKTRTRTRRESGWKTVANGGEAIPFYLQDDCGVVRVDSSRAEIQNVSVFSQTCYRSDPLYYAKGPSFAVSNSDHKRRFTEHAIPLHHMLYIMGTAREREDVVAPEIAYDRDAPMFLISTHSEDKITRGYHWKTWLLGILGLLLAIVAGVGYAKQQREIFPENASAAKPVHSVSLDSTLPAEFPQTHQADQSYHTSAEPSSNSPFGDLPVAEAIPAGGMYLVLWVLGWVWVVYNGIIDLRNRVRQGWANVSVQLKRRHDLIPSIVNIVKGFKDYENTVQTQLAELRSQADATRPGESGPDPHGCAKQLIALQEAYPNLKANEAFLKLQDELVHTEQRIALARTYYNEIAAFYNMHLQVVPDRFLAKLAGLKSEPFITAEDFERAAVKVNLAD